MYLGVEIGGTKLQVGVCDARGRLKQLVRTAVVRRHGHRGILRQLEQIIPPLLGRELEGRASSRPLPTRGHDRAWPFRVEAIGVGFGGPFDVGTGRAVRSHQIAGWDGFPVKQWFKRRFKLPVVIENDQNCAGLAEALCGAGKGLRRVLYITVGTGIGGGLILDGEIYGGRYGAAEIGHVKLQVNGRWRTVESVASGLAIERGASTVSQASRYLGIAVANAIAFVNPEIVIIGGGVSLAGEKFFRPLRQTVARHVFPVFRKNYRIVRPALGETVVVVGAALLAARK